MSSDDIVVILSRREAQGLYDLLTGGLAPKPQRIVPGRKVSPPVLVHLSKVFPATYLALENALKTEENDDERHAER